MCQTSTGSTLKTDKISAMMRIVTTLISAVADVPSYSKFFMNSGASDFLFQLTNMTGNGGVVSSFSLQSVGPKDINGNQLVLNANGELEQVNAPGVPVPDSDLLICVIKDRIDQCYPTTAVEVDGVEQIEGDTGSDGNCYNLEVNGQEIGYQTSEQGGGKDPCFLRVCVTASADEDFAMTTVECGLPFCLPPVTKEKIA